MSPPNRIPESYDQQKQYLDVVNNSDKVIGAFSPCLIRNYRTPNDSVNNDSIEVFPIEYKDSQVGYLGSMYSIVVNSPFEILPQGRGKVSRDWPLIARVADNVDIAELSKRPLYAGNVAFERHKAFWPNPWLYGSNCVWWALHSVESDYPFPLAMVTQSTAISDSSLNIVSVTSDWFDPKNSFEPVELKRFPDVELTNNEVANFNQDESEIELAAPGVWDCYLTVKVKSTYTGDNPSDKVPGFKLLFAVEPSPWPTEMGHLVKTGDERIMMHPIVGLIEGGDLPYTTTSSLVFTIGDIVESYGVNFVIDNRPEVSSPGTWRQRDPYKTKLNCMWQSYPIPLSNIKLSIAVRMLVVFRSFGAPGV